MSYHQRNNLVLFSSCKRKYTYFQEKLSYVQITLNKKNISKTYHEKTCNKTLRSNLKRAITVLISH